MPPAKRAGKMADKSPARATEAVTPGGKAKSTVNQRNNRLKKCERFLLHVADMSPELSARWGTDWDEVPEDELAQRDIWAHMADFLSNVYTIEEGAVNAGQHLGLKTAHGDWSGMIDTARKALEVTGRSDTKVRALAGPVPCAALCPRARGMTRHSLCCTVCVGEVPRLLSTALGIWGHSIARGCALHCRVCLHRARGIPLLVLTPRACCPRVLPCAPRARPGQHAQAYLRRQAEHQLRLD